MRNLSELKLEIPSIDPIESRSILGGGDYTASSTISASGEDNPYALDEVVVTPGQSSVPISPDYDEEENNSLQTDDQDSDSQDSEVADSEPTVPTIPIKGGTEADRATIMSVFSQLPQAMQTAISQLSNLQITIDPGLGKPGQYNSTTGELTLSSTNNLLAITEEFMHSFQATIGITEDPGSGNQPGHTNIEFEAKVLADYFSMSHYGEDGYGAVATTGDIQSYLSEVYSDVSAGIPIDISDFTDHISDMYYSDFIEWNRQNGNAVYSAYDDPEWDWHWEEFFDAIGIQYCQ